METLVVDETCDRALAQRLEALSRANAVRRWRKQMKLDLRAGRVRAADLIAAPPEELQSMQIAELLVRVPKVGRVKAMKWLQRARIEPSKTVGGLSPRQRSELLVYLR